MWFKLRYTLPVNEGGKPEITALQADTAEAASRRIIDHYTKKCKGVYGVPTILSIERYASWDDVKASIMNKGGEQ